MKQRLAGIFAVLVVGTSVHAQPQIGSYTPPVVNPRPLVSPYLNLNRTGGNAAVDYFGIVRPQMESQKSIQHLQQQFQLTQGQVGQHVQQATDEMAPTGRNLGGGFFNYGHYFPTFNRAGGGTGALGGMRR